MSKEVSQIYDTCDLADYVDRQLFQGATPFRLNNVLVRIVHRLFRFCIWCFEKICGHTLRIENTLLSASLYKGSTRNLLAFLLREKYISGWVSAVRRFGQVTYVFSNITASEIRHSNGDIILPTDALHSSGVAKNHDESMVVATAEILERIATCSWEYTDFMSASMRDLATQKYDHISHSFITTFNNKQNTTALDWVAMKKFGSVRSTYVNAEIVYASYRHQHVEGHWFMLPSSNGASVHVNWRKAFVAGVSEVVERDAFLLYWLSNVVPKNIDLDTHLDADMQTIVEDFRQRNFSLHLLDLSTEFALPTVALVIIDNIVGSVYVQTATGAVCKKVIEKVFADVAHWDFNQRDTSVRSERFAIRSFAERRALWHNTDMRQHIRWFLAGPTISYHDWSKNYTHNENVSEFVVVKKAIRRAGFAVYTYKYKHKLLKKVGLVGLRIFIPELVPLYASEEQKPLNVKRLYTFAQNLGQVSGVHTRDDLNNIPHPLL